MWLQRDREKSEAVTSERNKRSQRERGECGRKITATTVNQDTASSRGENLRKEGVRQCQMLQL